MALQRQTIEYFICIYLLLKVLAVDNGNLFIVNRVRVFFDSVLFLVNNCENV